ncbi:Response regulator [Balamuthia mandrillaris]
MSQDRWKNSPKFHLDQLLQYSDGDHEFEEDLIEEYKGEFERMTTSLEPLLQAGIAGENPDHEACVRLAHDVKGSSANIGAEGVRQVGKEMEDLAKAGKYDQVLALFPALHKEYAEFCQIWDDYKASW